MPSKSEVIEVQPAEIASVKEKPAPAAKIEKAKKEPSALVKYEDAEGREVVLTREDIINTISSNPRITDK